MILPFLSILLATITPVDNSDKISEAMGYWIGKNLQNLDLPLDLKSVAKEIAELEEGKNPSLSEEECAKAIEQIQARILEATSEENLKIAEAFLKDNGNKEGVVTLREGKLQYRVEHSGHGPAVQPHSTPLIFFTGKYLNGATFGSSLEPEPLVLDDVIEGLREGVVGMKEGEKRTFYIHPDLGYKTTGVIAPGTLLTIEVEIIKSERLNEEQPLIQGEFIVR